MRYAALLILCVSASLVLADEAAPGNLQSILSQYEKKKAVIWKEAHGKIGLLRHQTAVAMKELQDRYTRDAKLDEAVAIRDAIRSLKQGGLKALPDPGVLYVRNLQTPSAFYRVTGANRGPLWGTDVYSSDSSLAFAAVHAGVLKLGQTGIVKVTMIPSHLDFTGTTRNGVTSASWNGTYAAFAVAPLGDEDEADADQDACEITLTADLPGDAAQLIDQFNTSAANVRKEARQVVGKVRRETINELKPVQDWYTRAARLDEAVAIRDCIRAMYDDDLPVLADPSVLRTFSSKIGDTYYFRVTGNAAGGTVWGSDVYTLNSSLAAVAVHAGVLTPGQTAVVRVKIVAGQTNYPASTRNGVASYNFGPQPAGYVVSLPEK
jgi:hypothetical protein